MQIEKFEGAPSHEVLSKLYRQIETMPVETAGQSIHTHLDFWTSEQRLTLVEIQYLAKMEGCLWNLMGVTEEGTIYNITIQTKTLKGMIEVVNLF